jgi:hypothetical protein
MIIDGIGATKPDAGVMATNPCFGVYCTMTTDNGPLYGSAREAYRDPLRAVAIVPFVFSRNGWIPGGI